VLNFLVATGIVASIYGILAVTLHLEAGTTGLVNFGLIGFFGIGAYATGIGGIHEIAWPLAIVIGMAVATLAGAAGGLLGRTLGAEYWAVATLALAELLRLVALNTNSLTRGSEGISTIVPFFARLGPSGSNNAWLGLSVAVLAVCVLIAYRLTDTQFGRVLRLVRENEDLAASLSHDVVRAKVRVMAISAPMAALAGSLYTHYVTFIGPDELEPFGTFLVFAMVIVGGLGNLGGVVLGAFLVQLLYDVTRYMGDLGISPATTAALRILVVGAVLLGFLLFRPGGLLPERLRQVDANRLAMLQETIRRMRGRWSAGKQPPPSDEVRSVDARR
jgi:branched-chain amino acid transport system permease protein